MSSIAETREPPLKKNAIARQKDNIAQLSEISRNSRTTFMALILACVYSYLAIASTKDAALLSNSNATPLPIIQTNVPIVWFYYFAPIILAVLFLYFHLYLERFWRCVAMLPLRHPDGRGLDDYIYPWLISNAIIRGEIRELSMHRVSAWIEAWLSLLLAWWLVPSVLVFYWARYLAAHDWPGTALHIALIMLLAGFALRFYFIAKNALRRMAGAARRHGGMHAAATEPPPALARAQLASATAASAIVGIVLVYLSASPILGLPRDVCSKAGLDTVSLSMVFGRPRKLCAEAGVCTGCALFPPGREFWRTMGVKPYINIDEQRLVGKPENWQSLLSNRNLLESYLDTQATMVLSHRDLRNMSAVEAFLPGTRLQRVNLDYADLRHGAMTASRFEHVTLAESNLTDADLRYARIDNSYLDDVVAETARFQHASFGSASSADVANEGQVDVANAGPVDMTRLSGDFNGAYFDDAIGNYLVIGTRLHAGVTEGVPASLSQASFKNASFIWSKFNHVDFGDANLEGATLTNNRFYSVDFSGAVINGASLDKSTFTKCTFVSSKIENPTLIKDSSFEDVKFIDSTIGSGRLRTSLSSDAAEARAPVGRIEKFYGWSAQFIGGTRIRNVELSHADLRDALFENVELVNVLFSDSDLSGAIIKQVDLSKVRFKNVDLTAADLSEAKGVTPRLLKGACGNAETKLPSGVKIAPCKL